MINRIGLSNFKCFGDKSEIELAPLTIITGVNGSGKSTIFDVLLALKQSYLFSQSDNCLDLYNEFIKYPEYSVKSKCGTDDEIVIEFGGTISANKETISDFDFLRKDYQFAVDNIDVSVKIVLKEDDEFRPNLRQKKQLITLKAYNSRIENQTTIKFIVEDKPNTDGSYSTKLAINGLPQRFRQDYDYDVLNKTVNCSFCGLNLIAIEDENNDDELFEEIGNHLINLFNLIGNQFNRFDLKMSSLDCSLDFEQITGISNSFFPPIVNTIDKNTGYANYKNCILSWMKYFGYSDNMVYDNLQYQFVDGFDNMFRTVSSVLLQKENNTLLLHNPESCSFPTAQLGMADLLVTAAMNGKNLIVETNSDHIINRVVRRMMEDDDVAKQVIIYFLDKKDDYNSFVTKINVDKTKGVVADNSNFFGQFASETEKIICTGFNNLKRG